MLKNESCHGANFDITCDTTGCYYFSDINCNQKIVVYLCEGR